ncbi:MAG: 50S ribosomal protein L18a [Nanoarchaeota archaeon]|nr:50S ribosomal protein L18a [Nanoarchaeota archaeon]
MFIVSGEYRKVKRVFNFKKIVEAKTEIEAKHKVCSILGSNHQVKRHLINILEVKKQ